MIMYQPACACGKIRTNVVGAVADGHLNFGQPHVTYELDFDTAFMISGNELLSMHLHLRGIK